MKVYWILFSVICLLSFCTPAQGIFGSSSFQDYVESLVDGAKFKAQGMLSVNDSTVSRMWSYFKSKYGRAYGSLDEEKKRFRIFYDHLKFILESKLNQFRTFDLELNEYGDWTTDEFDSLKKGLTISSSLRRRLIKEDSKDEDSVRRSLYKLHQRHYHLQRLKRNMISRRHHQLRADKRGFFSWIQDLLSPEKNNNNNTNNNNNNNAGQPASSFDWRTKNVVGSIKNQLNCGCCYAFATAAVLESLYAIKTNAKTVTDLSPQQITDCSTNGNNGCNGGNFAPSVRYVLGQGNKLATFASYPYAGKKQTCQTNQATSVNLGTIQYGAIPEGDEKTMASTLMNNGPLFIGLDADSKLFMFYKSGILTIPSCPNRRQDMDHAMVVVGYAYDNALKLPYWIIKNSWGEKWGENGYLRLVKDKANMCGIASMAYYAKLT